MALGRLKAVVDGALVCVAERLEETRGAEAIGWASTKDFLTHLTGGRKGCGACLVRVAQHTAVVGSPPRSGRSGSMTTADVCGTAAPTRSAPTTARTAATTGSGSGTP